MKKINVGIDISKEKCNLCYRSGLEIVREEECSNEVKALKKTFKAAFKALGVSMEDILVCAEYTGRYIYPLTVACQDLDIFLWLDDPTRIKNSMGQSEWGWAAGRLTAGFVLDCRSIPSVGQYIMFFHGSGPLTETEGDFDKNSSIGIAWSDDLQSWAWPD